MRRALPAGLVPNSSWLLHSGLQEELPDPHSLAACRSPEQPCVTSSGMAKPQQHPHKHLRAPIPQHDTPPSPPGGANITQGPQDPSGPGPSLTMKAEKPSCGHWPQRNGAPLSLQVKSVSSLIMKKGWRQTNVLGQNTFLLRIIKNDRELDALRPSCGRGLGKAFGSLICEFGAEWFFWRKELTAWKMRALFSKAQN